MELYAKGQLSYLILTCLQERDFYGLDIISEISARSYGKINLKKPSVYSNLTRMEKQNYVSSYLQSSNYGPNRKYYSLTEKGRGFYQELKAYFDMNKIDVFRDFADLDAMESPAPTQINNQSSPANTKDLTSQEEKEEKNDEYFDFSDLNKDVENQTVSAETQREQIKKDEDSHIQSTIIEHVYPKQQEEEFTKTNYFVTPPSPYGYEEQKDNTKVNTPENAIPPEKKDDAVFLSKNENADEYNQRLYDISKDINKIKRKRSFAEDQIAMSAADPLVESNDKKRANIQEFKNSILENKMKYRTTGTTNYEMPKSKNYTAIFERQNQQSIKPKEEKEEIKDDAKLITGKIDENSIGRARKIEPPRLKIVSENTKDTRLPAPKRDTSIDPSHREILNRLYSKTKDNSSGEIRDDAIYDYNDLKEFYESQNISFNIYQKSKEKTEHNTNLIYLIISVVTSLAAILSSALLFVILHFTKNTFGSTNFLYILLPALLIIDIIWKFYNYKTYSSWLPNQLIPSWKIWAFFILSSCVVVGLNLIFGIATGIFSHYATTLILPIILLFIVFPMRYYMKKFALVKYWK